MTYEELMAGADALNAYYRAVDANGIDRMDITMVEAESVIDGYEQLLSDYAEKAGCYTEWDERRTDGLEEVWT